MASAFMVAFVLVVPVDPVAGRGMRCDDTCLSSYAKHLAYPINVKNGKCEDGSASSVSDACRPGTDCTDCGPGENQPYTLTDNDRLYASCDPWGYWGPPEHSLTSHGDMLDFLAELYREDPAREALARQICLTVNFTADVCKRDCNGCGDKSNANTIRQTKQCDYLSSTRCPPHLRSVSGCGDFAAWESASGQCGFLEGRDVKVQFATCENKLDREAWVISHSAPRYFHVAPESRIDFSKADLPFYEQGVPPTIAVHRQMWPKWGQYTYLPTERWLHHVEHGGIALLYQPCLNERDVCRLQRFASAPGAITMVQPNYRGGTAFRWVLTPYPGLAKKFAIASFGKVLLRDCFNESEAAEFVHDNYGHGDIEKNMFTNGQYDWMWHDAKQSREECGRILDPPQLALPLTVASSTLLTLSLTAKISLAVLFSAYMMSKGNLATSQAAASRLM
jgi:hypothetical protein